MGRVLSRTVGVVVANNTTRIDYPSPTTEGEPMIDKPPGSPNRHT